VAGASCHIATEELTKLPIPPNQIQGGWGRSKGGKGKRKGKNMSEILK